MAHDDERAANVEAVVKKLQAEGVQPVWVDRAPVFDKTTLLHALYQALQLPGWFGFNWDALEECLFDTAGNGVPRVLVFHDFELLEEHDAAAAETFLDIVRTVSSNPASALRGVVRVHDMIPDRPSRNQEND
jgi:RNAse (barnase) inhibitor barstar